MTSDVQLQPLVLEPYGWAGNNGNWSTFRIEVGNPPQPFQILPSTCSNEVWIPTPQGCKVPVANCTDSRGVLSTSGSSSRGFQSNTSDTWQLINVLDLGSEDHYFSGQEGGLYGLDTLSVGKDPATTLSNQIVAGIATSNFWLGILGLGNIPAEFTTSDGLIPSFVTSLKNNKITQSLSYGYGAGAAYRSSPGSLIIGGYDQAAFASSYVQPNTIAAGRRSLPIWLRSLVITNTLIGTTSVSIAEDGVRMAIDSTVSQLWLPKSMCDYLATVLGLRYEDRRGYYYINNTTHEQLLHSNPEFTFTLSDEHSTATTNVALPYAAFDLMIGPPVYESDLRYFPIRRSSNRLQNTLGRAFLQEAYLVVDWERSTFKIGQASHHEPASRAVIAISPVKHLSTGAIAGIAVGVTIAVVSIVSTIFFLWRKRRRRRNRQSDGSATLAVPGEADEDVETKNQRWSELSGATAVKTTPELQGEAVFKPSQLMSQPLHELPADARRAELEGPDTGQLVRRQWFPGAEPHAET